ncbi:MFS transporter [Klebsiella quasivariicola]|uniref:Major facilitator superfamily transporter n=1 Tax=Klebsiella quasivariicola TaxID=2026240 RepID=A0ABY6WXF0_9ENTR|nr:MFS transporter [Klebsiella quasivariicola]ASV19339.1 MFS transporter [Klebsiella quasivariicola]MCJ1827124.1 MFS transporter [Klebsiella quasivariicola]NBZ74175.1 MFS transporter [Klebsiella quasivariicola]VGP89027.1 Multidrug resistance protein MdtG [Klebsiella quasivariicola]VVJ42056.1 major facilitator superfamily transporter [Klebsiella quasivariicola]
MKEKLWTKDFWAITIVSFIIFFVFYVLLTLLPIYIAENLHATADKAGLLVTFFLVAAIIVRPFAGQWVGKYSNKGILLISSLAFLVVTALYPFCHTIEGLLFIRVLHGITFGVITTVKGTISARLIPASRRGEGISFFSLAMGLAMVVGPWIGLNMARHSAYIPAFWMCTVVSAIAIVLSMMICVPPVIRHADGSQPKLGFSAMFDRAAMPFALVTFFMTFSYAGVSAFLALYARELDLMAAASNFLLCYAIFLMICRAFTGNVCDKKGPKYVVYPCLLAFTIGLVVLGYTHGSVSMILSGALIGIGYGSVTPVFQTQIISSVETHKIGVANSLFFNAMDAGLAIGAFVMGIMVDGVGYRAIYLVGALLVVVAGLIYVLQMKRHGTMQLVSAHEVH